MKLPTLLLTAALTSCNPSHASTICSQQKELVTAMAIARDRGVPEDRTKILMYQNGFTVPLANSLIDLIYDKLRYETPANIGTVWYNICVKQP